MRYQLFISGTPTPSTRPPRRSKAPLQETAERAQTADSSARGKAAEAAGRFRNAGARSQPAGGSAGTSPQTFVRRFPPVLQFLNRVDPLFEQQAQALVLQWYRKGMSLGQVCDALHDHARMLGFEATLGVQEVFSSAMPSFPNQTVTSALLMVDLNRIEAPEGFHRRMAV